MDGCVGITCVVTSVYILELPLDKPTLNIPMKWLQSRQLQDFFAKKRQNLVHIDNANSCADGCRTKLSKIAQF